MKRLSLAFGLGILVGAGLLLAFGARFSGGGHHDDDHDHASESGHKDDHDHGKEGKEKDDDGTVRLSEPALKVARIRNAAVEKRKIGPVITATGVIKPNAQQLAHVTPKIAGKVSEVLAVQGSKVKKGDPLIVLDSIEMGAAAAELLKAKSALEVAKINFDREGDLMKRNATRGSDFYEARNQHLKTQTDYQAARGKLLLLGWTAEKVDALKWDDPVAMSRLSVAAPFEGEVTEKHAAIGELVSPETTVFTISNLSTVWVELDLFQRDVGQVHESQAVEIICDAHPGKVFKAKVTYVGQAVSEDTRTLKVRVEVDNKEGHLKPGMFITAYIRDDQDEHAPERVVVPAAAIQQVDNLSIVFIAKTPGVFEKRGVTLGQRFGDVYEVVVGLDGGESVVTDGGFILKSELLRSQMGHDHAH